MYRPVSPYTLDKTVNTREYYKNVLEKDPGYRLRTPDVQNRQKQTGNINGRVPNDLHFRTTYGTFFKDPWTKYTTGTLPSNRRPCCNLNMQSLYENPNRTQRNFINPLNKKNGVFEPIPHMTQASNVYKPGSRYNYQKPIVDKSGQTTNRYEQINPPFYPYPELLSGRVTYINSYRPKEPEPKIIDVDPVRPKEFGTSLTRFREAAAASINPGKYFTREGYEEYQGRAAGLSSNDFEKMKEIQESDKRGKAMDYTDAKEQAAGVTSAEYEEIKRRQAMEKPTKVNYDVMRKTYQPGENPETRKYNFPIGGYDDRNLQPQQQLPPHIQPQIPEKNPYLEYDEQIQRRQVQNIPPQQQPQQQKVEAPKYNYPTGGYEDRNVPQQQPQQGGRNPYLEYEQAPQQAQQGGRNPYLEYEQPPQPQQALPPQQGGRNPYLDYEQPPQQAQQGGRNPYLDYEQPPQQEEFIAKNYQRTQNFENPQQEPQMLPTQTVNLNNQRNPYLEEEPMTATQSKPPTQQMQQPQQMQQRQVPQNKQTVNCGGGQIINSNESSGVFDAINQGYIHNVNNYNNTFGKGQMSNNMEDYNNYQNGIPLQDRPALKQGAESNESYGVSSAINANFVPYDGSVGPQKILDISEYGPRNGPSEYKIGKGNQSAGVCGVFHGED